MPTKIKVKPLNVLVWIFENFHVCPQEYDNNVDSPLFICGVEVQMKLFPCGVSDDCREFVSFFLEMKNISDNIVQEFKLEMTDGEDNLLVLKEFQVTPREQKVEICVLKFIKRDKLLYRIAKSKSDSVIIKCYFKGTTSKNPVTYLVARTLIGVEECFFTWCVENFEYKCSKKKIMYFPKLDKLEFNLEISETKVEIAILKWDHDSCDDDDEFDRDDDYGSDCERSLVFKISFLTMAGKKLMTYQDFMCFLRHGKDSEIYCYSFKKDSVMRSETKNVSLMCEVSVSFGTYLKHIKPKECSASELSQIKI